MLLNIGNEHDDYLRDESRKTGKAEFIAFPKTEDEAIRIVMHAYESGITVTTQGSRTGIAAGAVPEGGIILNLSRMNRIRLFTLESILQYVSR